MERIYEAPLEVVQIGDLIMSPGFPIVTYKGKEIVLTPIQSKALYFFYLHRDTIVTRDQLMDYLWGEGEYRTASTISRLLLCLRSRLGLYLETIPKKGYILHVL
jgi:DNA-binding response OmpR family regulator